MSGVNSERVERAVSEAVKEELRDLTWPVYKQYEIVEEHSEVFVVAPNSLDSFKESKPKGKQAFAKSRVKGYWWRMFEGSAPAEDVQTIYQPLRTPELVLDLAELAEGEITPKAVLGWAETYGLLGLPGEDVVTATGPVGVGLRHSGAGRKESVGRFAEVAQEVRACLRIYEAVTAGVDLDLDRIDHLADLLPREAFRLVGSRERHAGKERPWLFAVLGRMVQMRLHEHCSPHFSTYVRDDGSATGRFALSWGFKGLLGALWLHVAWLLEAEGNRVRRCKLPDCLRVIHFEPGQPPDDPGLRKNVRGTYRTRIDRVFCKRRGCKQKYHYRKKAGWPGYH